MSKSKQKSTTVPVAATDLNTESTIEATDEKPMSISTLYRDSIIDNIVATLISKTASNVLLVGEHGVGKTAIINEIGRRISVEDPTIPQSLQHRRMFCISLVTIVAGTYAPGQLEAKIEQLLSDASELESPMIVCIPDIHELSSHTHPAYDRIAQMLKSALEQELIQIIGTSTNLEATSILNDPLFTHCFTRINVPKLTANQTLEVIKENWCYLVSHYNTPIALPTDNVLSHIISLADEHNKINSRPKNTIELIDKTCANLLVLNTSNKENKPITITEDDIKRIAYNQTSGDSVAKRIDFNALAKAFSPILGQQQAIKEITRALRRQNLGIFPQTSPNTYLLAGSIGVGKSMCANVIANAITSTPPITLNMSEFANPAALARLTEPAAPVPNAQTGAEILFETLNIDPHQVIILEEFEKAHPLAVRFFMNIFDEGVLKSQNGKEIDFSKATIIATANVGVEYTTKSTLGFISDDCVPSAEQISTKLSNTIDPSVLSRFNTVIAFDSIDKATYEKIVFALYETELARISRDFPLYSDVITADTAEVNSLAVKTYVARLGARPAKSAVKTFIENRLLQKQEAKD